MGAAVTNKQIEFSIHLRPLQREDIPLMIIKQLLVYGTFIVIFFFNF